MRRTVQQRVWHTLPKSFKHRKRSRRARVLRLGLAIFALVAFLKCCLSVSGPFIFGPSTNRCMLSRRLVGYCLIDDDNISDLFYLAKYQRQIAPSGRKSISEDTSIFHSLAPPGSRNCHGRRRRRQHIAPSVKVISVVSKEHLRIGLTQNFFDSVSERRATRVRS